MRQGPVPIGHGEIGYAGVSRLRDIAQLCKVVVAEMVPNGVLGDVTFSPSSIVCDGAVRLFKVRIGSHADNVPSNFKESCVDVYPN